MILKQSLRGRGTTILITTYLESSGVSISIACCLRVYCQIANIATHENPRFPPDMAVRKTVQDAQLSGISQRKRVLNNRNAAKSHMKFNRIALPVCCKVYTSSIRQYSIFHREQV